MTTDMVVYYNCLKLRKNFLHFEAIVCISLSLTEERGAEKRGLAMLLITFTVRGGQVVRQTECKSLANKTAERKEKDKFQNIEPFAALEN